MRKLKIPVSFCLFLLSTSIYAGGGLAMVRDAQTETNTYNSWQELMKEYDELEKQYDTLNKQYNQLQSLYSQGNQILSTAGDIQNDLNGSGNYKNLLNETNEIVNQTEWTAQDWDDALKGMSGGNQARYDELKNEYQSTYNTVNNQVVSDSQYEKGTSPDNAKVHEQDEKVNQTVYSSSSYEYAQLNDIANQIKSIGDQIDGADTTKKTLDLQAKLSEQIAYIQLEALKMQTIQNQQISETEARSLNGETQSSVYLASLGGD